MVWVTILPFHSFSQSLVELSNLAESNKDAHLEHYVKNELLNDQVDAMRELAGHHTNLQRVGDGLGVFVFDRHLNSN